jgi:hypothetical protein
MTMLAQKMMQGSIVHNAARTIYTIGPMLPEALFSRVHFGDFHYLQMQALHRAVKNGWLVIGESGVVNITEAAHKQIETELAKPSANEPVYQGVKAEPRQVNVLKRPAYVPPKRAIRQDVPDWSKRPDGFSFYTVA